MKPDFIVKRKLVKIGGTTYLPIPPDLCEYLEIEYEENKPITEISMMPDKSKHGRFVGIWNEKQQGGKK